LEQRKKEIIFATTKVWLLVLPFFFEVMLVNQKGIKLQGQRKKEHLVNSTLKL
jgi:hypothetical protein